GIQVQNHETVTLDVVMAAQPALSETVVVGYGILGKKKRHAAPKKPLPANQKVISTIPKHTPRSEQPQLVIAFEPETYEEKMIWVYSDGSPAPSPDSIDPEYYGEQYDPILENPFQKTAQSNISTFSIDVDAASYANIRRFLEDDVLPPANAVRIEEMINYFDYDYPKPAGAHPFEINTEVAPCPWNPEHKLMLVGLQGQQIDVGQLPSANLVFLIDVSGSMDEADKLPLVIESLNMLTDQLRSNDKVAIVVYAGAAGLVLNSTPGNDKRAIKDALAKLNAGGSTAGGAGIQLAYQTARNNFVPGGNNRVILCTDGDFNVGVSSEQDLVHLIEKERADGIYLTVLGFGDGNYQDGKMQNLADKGNGNHAYIDGLKEAKKVLVQEFGGTVFAIAKDVKLQLHFNPELLEGYRLIGYENRILATEDFNDDTKDAGELGVGHRVTALYELVPTGRPLPPMSKIDSALVVVQKPDASVNIKTSDLMVLQLRYKKPQGDQPSRLMEYRLNAASLDRSTMSDNFKLASAVAEFGLLLRNSKFRGEASFSRAESRARATIGSDVGGYRLELIQLIQKANELYSNK
ncbi:MAG: VWA domain-containing protein, partial [Saprospiraceae bacterium]|nr:VWA domain-containing protein [Saprospiraceae bacterium]